MNGIDIQTVEEEVDFVVVGGVSCLAKESLTIELTVTLSGGGGVRRDQLAVPHGR